MVCFNAGLQNFTDATQVMREDLCNCRTYVYPKDMSSLKRYFLIFFALLGFSIIFLGPLIQIYLAQPMINLMLGESGIITPDSGCFNPKLENQTCPAEVNVDYYFWNITNYEKVCITKLVHNITLDSKGGYRLSRPEYFIKRIFSYIATVALWRRTATCSRSWTIQFQNV